jgi:hypothetical protein
VVSSTHGPLLVASGLVTALGAKLGQTLAVLDTFKGVEHDGPTLLSVHDGAGIKTCKIVRSIS